MASPKPPVPRRAETQAIRAGQGERKLPKTVGPPIQKGSTVLLPDAASLYDDVNLVTYGRQGLSTQFALQAALGEMEGAVEGGVTLYPSGLAALTGALLALLKTGDEVLASDVIYKPNRRFCDRVLRQFGIAVRYFDPRQPPDELVAGASDKTKLILMESPGSLSFEMQDMPAVADLARARRILTVADNTWGAGYLFKPLAHGIDLSIQALTKYVGGHSDAFMGSVAVKDARLAHQLAEGVINLGWSVSGEDAYLMLRGLRTLPTRLARHGESGLKVAAWLSERPEVVKVFHPALPGAPDHALWKRDFSGACGLFAFSLVPGPKPAVDAFLDALTLFGLGFSWGGFESLAIACDHQLVIRDTARDYGGPLIRLHIGLENPDDLIADLAQALDAYMAARG